MKNKLEIPTYKPVKSNKIWENSHRIREKYSMKYDDNMKIRYKWRIKRKFIYINHRKMSKKYKTEETVDVF